MERLLLVLVFCLALCDSISLYVGNGCFFHMQHVMVVDFEQVVLNRTGLSITAISGYAGGTPKTELCYHNKENR